MSRIGKAPVVIPEGVDVTLDGQRIEVTGPKGTLGFAFPAEVTVVHAEGTLQVAPRNASKRARQMWGMVRTHLRNLVLGVTEGCERFLDLSGVGYRAQASGDQVRLSLGLSHEVVYRVPPGITIETPRPTEIRLTGIDRQAVGHAAAEIRRFRPPEPYKGKGIAHRGERIYRKTPRRAQG